MKKRILALLLLFLMMISFVIPLASKTIKKTNKNDDSEIQQKPDDVTICKNVTYTVMQQKAIQKDEVEIAIEEMAKEMEAIESITDNKEYFIAYQQIVEKYSEVIDPPETIYDYYTEDEIELICRVVETECYDADFDSKCNVASVVFNRFESEKFDGTFTQIITAKNQFAYGRRNISEDTMLAVMYVFEFGDTTNGALYFHSNPKTDKFNGSDYIFTDSVGHCFYK